MLEPILIYSLVDADIYISTRIPKLKEINTSPRSLIIQTKVSFHVQPRFSFLSFALLPRRTSGDTTENIDAPTQSTLDVQATK